MSLKKLGYSEIQDLFARGIGLTLDRAVDENGASLIEGTSSEGAIALHHALMDEDSFGYLTAEERFSSALESVDARLVRTLNGNAPVVDYVIHQFQQAEVGIAPDGKEMENIYDLLSHHSLSQWDYGRLIRAYTEAVEMNAERQQLGTTENGYEYTYAWDRSTELYFAQLAEAAVTYVLHNDPSILTEPYTSLTEEVVHVINHARQCSKYAIRSSR